MKILKSLGKVMEVFDDTTLAQAVGLTDGDQELEELHRHLAHMEESDLVKTIKTRGRWHAHITQAGVTYRKHEVIDLDDD